MGKRRGRNEGSIRWIESKQLWEGRYIVGYQDDGSPRKKCIYGQKNEKGAVLAQMREALVQLGHKTYVEDTDKTLGVWCREWYDLYKKPTIKTNTRAKYEVSFVRLNRYDIALIPLSRLASTAIQRCYNDMAEDGNTETHMGLSEETIKATHALINGALEMAEDLNMIPKNPARKVFIPKPIDQDDFEETHAKALSPEQRAKFLKRMGEKTKHFFFAYFCLHTGLRPGEALALTISDVDLKKDQVKVTKTFIEKERRVQASTKTKSSRRTVDIPSELKSVVMEHLIKLPARKPGDPFFQTSSGKRPTASYLRKRYKAAGKDTDFDWVNLHTMRHTYASDLFSKGVDIKVISAQLGHKDVTTTYDIYVHLIEGAKNTAVQVLNDGIIEHLPTPKSVSKKDIKSFKKAE